MAFDSQEFETSTRPSIVNQVRDMIGSFCGLVSEQSKVKCFTHQDREALAVCIQCGRAVCLACVKNTTTNRVVCSNNCEAGLTESERLIQLIKNKTLSQNKVSAMIYFLVGAIALVFTFIPLASGNWPLVLWTGPFGVAMIIGGIWLRRVAKESK